MKDILVCLLINPTEVDEPYKDVTAMDRKMLFVRLAATDRFSVTQPVDDYLNYGREEFAPGPCRKNTTETSGAATRFLWDGL